MKVNLLKALKRMQDLYIILKKLGASANGDI